jgi:hypothetical protein
MVNGIRRVSVERGYDPRDFVLVGAGGATAAHITALAREMGIGTIILPKLASGLCAFGQIISDVKYNYMATAPLRLDNAAAYKRIDTLYKQIEKQGIIDMLKGKHQVTVNGFTQNIYIEDVRVTPEGGAAFWSNPQMGMFRIIDCGSGTINAATIIDKKFINSSSDTFNFGAETIKNKNDMSGMARGIIRNTSSLKWQKNDVIWVCGGIAEQITPFIQLHYPNAVLLTPNLSGVMRLKPVFSNACGYYDLAKRVFK